MRRLLNAALITAVFTSGCASNRPAADVAKLPVSAAASPPADVSHSPGTFRLAHPFSRRPEWVAPDYWAQDHPVLFLGVVVPAAVLATLLFLTAASVPGH